MLATTSRFSDCIWQGQKKHARMPYIHCGPFKKKRKERKRKERLRGRKKSIRLSSEETASKKRVRHDW